MTIIRRALCTATAASAGGSSGAGERADISFDDQSGAGDSVQVARVVLPAAGFVVVTADGDDFSEDADHALR